MAKSESNGFKAAAAVCLPKLKHKLGPWREALIYP